MLLLNLAGPVENVLKSNAEIPTSLTAMGKLFPVLPLALTPQNRSLSGLSTHAPVITPAMPILTNVGAVETKGAVPLTWTCQSGPLKSSLINLTV